MKEGHRSGWWPAVVSWPMCPPARPCPDVQIQPRTTMRSSKKASTPHAPHRSRGPCARPPPPARCGSRPPGSAGLWRCRGCCRMRSCRQCIAGGTRCMEVSGRQAGHHLSARNAASMEHNPAPLHCPQAGVPRPVHPSFTSRRPKLTALPQAHTTAPSSHHFPHSSQLTALPQAHRAHLSMRSGTPVPVFFRYESWCRRM